MRWILVMAMITIPCARPAVADLLKSPADGRTYDVPPEQVARYLAEGYVPVTTQERSAEITRQAMEARAEEEARSDFRWHLWGAIAVALVAALAVRRYLTRRR